MFQINGIPQKLDFATIKSISNPKCAGQQRFQIYGRIAMRWDIITGMTGALVRLNPVRAFDALKNKTIFHWPMQEVFKEYYFLPSSSYGRSLLAG